MNALKAHTPHQSPPPAHLAPRGKAFWQAVLDAYEMDVVDLARLLPACEQLDRAESARLQIERDGVTVKDRFGQPKPHPAVEIERQAHATFLRLVRELAIDVEVPASRPPNRRGYR